MRAATGVRLLLGSALTVFPREVLDLVGGLDRDDGRTRLIARVLGARMVGQAGLDLVCGPRARTLDVAVDVTHALSMLAVAGLAPAHRRSALASAACAGAVAALDAAGGRAG
jgi:hypothetical protein